MALTDKLTAIGDAIRDKTGSTDLLTLDAMPTAISGIETGGGELPEEVFTITGTCSYRFANGGWDWFIENYGDKITTNDITVANNMFLNSKVKEIPFDINFVTSDCNVTYMLKGCETRDIPTINNLKPNDTSNMLSCPYVREIPDNFDATWDWSHIENATSAYNSPRSHTFADCYSLRKFPMEHLNHGNPVVSPGYSIYSSAFSNCYVLDEVAGLPFPHKNVTWTSNAFGNIVAGCYRLKRFTFSLQEDGTPYVVDWKSQTIELSRTLGYSSGSNSILNYNSGVTEDKQVTDDASYQTLKDDPDYWTTNLAYSRYNHDSAVETINSLPDTSAYLASAGGTNTIKFNKGYGSSTDGGAISTLTEEEIAVATAKGWTVTLI